MKLKGSIKEKISYFQICFFNVFFKGGPGYKGERGQGFKGEGGLVKPYVNPYFPEF